MTGLWADDRHALAAGIDATYRHIAYTAADHLIDTGAVRVLDYSDDVRLKIRDAIADEFAAWHPAVSNEIDRATDAVIEALRRP